MSPATTHFREPVPAGAGGEDLSALEPQVYEQLRSLAASALSGRQPSVTLQATALVHEAWMRMAVQGDQRFHKNRTHFVAIAAMMIRRVLIDHLRRRRADRRGGRSLHVTLVDEMAPHVSAPALDLLALDEAMQRLAKQDSRKARVVELKFFGGLTMVEIARHLGISERRVVDDWAMARAWLKRELSGPRLG